jgi:hypothetical protein
MASILKHLRSSTADKRPVASGLADGQIAINTASGTPAMFFKDSNGGVVKVGPAHVGAAAPNAVPAGSAGNSLGELWVDNSLTTPGLNYYTGSAFVNLTPSGTTAAVGLVELATPAETQTGTDGVRAVTPSGLQSKVSDSTSTTSSTTIASSTAVKSAYDLANAALPKAGGTVTGELLIGTTGSLVFEGSSDDSFETTIAVTNPTADHTITFPNVTGAVVTTGDSGTVTSTMIANDTIVNADINSAAAIVDTKLATISTADKVSVSALNIDGATDIGGALENGDLFIVDDGAGGTNRKAPAFRMAQLTYSGVTGDITIASGGTSAIGAGVIVNADVNASAAIAHSKLANITAGSVLLGNATNVPTATALTGDVTVNSSGVTAISSGVIVNADVNASAAIAGTKISPDFGSQTITTTGVVSAALGAAATPSITFTGDLNTGIYSPGADQVAISTNGSGKLFIDSAGIVSVGIANAGTANNIFQVNSESVPGDGIGIYSDFTATGAELGAVNFYPSASANGASARVVSIDNRASGVGSRSGSLAFHTANAGVAAEKLRITNDGKVGIGTTNPGTPLHVNYSSSNTWTSGENLTGTTNVGICGFQIANTSTSASAESSLLFATGDTNVAQHSITSIKTGSLSGDLAFRRRNGANGSLESLRLDSSGRLLVGTSTSRSVSGDPRRLQIEGADRPSSSLSLTRNSNDIGPPALVFAKTRSTSVGGNAIVSANDLLGFISFAGADGVDTDSEGASIAAFVDGTPGANDMPGRLVFSTTKDGQSSPTEACRIDSSQRLLIGTSTSRTVTNTPQILTESVNTTTGDRGITIVNGGASASAPLINFAKHRSASIGGTTVVSDGDFTGAVIFNGSDGTNFIQSAFIAAQVDGTPGTNDMPGRLVFSTTADGASSPTERMRITSGGEVLIAKTVSDLGTAGVRIKEYINITRAAGTPLSINRLTNDGGLIDFFQDGTLEGSISVSGTTVTYGGGHLARWSQLPNDEDPSSILKGTLMSNLDEMCEWGDEDNEQLNKTKVSDVEGDPNVAGVFVSTSFSDDGPLDFFVAMTGDMIIRIAEGVTVQRGDLLMSAGDGTAKPQDDDIIRSKTIAKVTSNHVTCTYDDGSYCVPCVLMAC